MSKKLYVRLTILLLTVLSLVGMLTVLYSTTWGPIVYSDAAGYILISRTVMEGHGLGVIDASGKFNQLSSNPPLFPLTLAALSRLAGVDPTVTTRLLNALLFGVSLALSSGVFILMGTHSLEELLGALVVGIFLVTSSTWIRIYCEAMSDPLGLATALGGIVCLFVYLVRQKGEARPGRGWLIAAALSFSLSVLTRYISVAFLPAAALSVLLFSSGKKPSPWKRRLGDTTLFSAASLLPVVGWVVWVNAQPRAEPIRNFAIHPAEIGQLFANFRIALVEMLWGWLPFSQQLPAVHYRLQLALESVFFLAVAFLAFWAMRKLRRQGTLGDGERGWLVLLGMSVLFAVVYIGSLMTSYLLTYPKHTLIERYYLPFQFFLWLAMLAIWGLCLRAWPRAKALYALPVVLIALYAASALPGSLTMVDQYHREGYGYMSMRSRQSPLLQGVRELPTDIPWISNDPVFVYFHTGKPTYAMSEIYLRQPLETYTRFGDDASEDSQQAFRQEGGALILFEDIRWQLDPIYNERTTERLEALIAGLEARGNFADGAVYFYPQEP